MVKGLTKRVVIMKPPEKGMFDEIIFIVKEDLSSSGVSGSDVVHEAERIAREYMEEDVGRRFLSRLPAPLYAIAGAAAVGIAWASFTFL